MCHCSNLYHVYNHKYNNNCLVRYPKHTTIHLIFTMAIFKPQLFCSHATLHADWILTECCPFIYARLQSDEGSWSGTFGVSPSREFFCDYLIVRIELVVLLLLVYVYGRFVSIYLCCVYYVHIAFCRVIGTYLFHAHDLCFCSFCLWFSCETTLGRFDLRNNIKIIYVFIAQ